MLWIILTLMTLAAAAYVAAPFLRPIDRAAAAQSSDLGIFRDQLAEIDREAAAGLIEPAAAESARTEIKRRMLTADKAAASVLPATPLTALEYKFAFLSMIAFTVLGSAILYAYNGTPELPSSVRMQGTRPGPAASTEAPAQGMAGTSTADVDTAITKLAERLKTNPDDVRGWAMLGWSYAGTGKFPEAIVAYRKAIALDPKNANIKSGLSQSLIKAADGKVTPEALAVIDEVLALDPKEAGARFDKGLAKLQGGDAKGALDDWIVQLKEAGPEDQWPAELRQRIIETAKENKIDVSGRLPAEVAVAAPAAPAAPAASVVMPTPGPSQADIDAAKSMSTADQTAMIKGMVERLAAKLEANPRNVDGWIQLMRSHKVMGDLANAKVALKKAMGVFEGAADEKAKLTAAANELGIAP
jgi:cytochrome c-type biogenesis protein CcmH